MIEVASRRARSLGISATGPAAAGYHQLGRLAQDRGDYAEADRQYRRALEIVEALGDRADMARTLSQLGVLLTERGNTEDAVGYTVRSLTPDPPRFDLESAECCC